MNAMHCRLLLALNPRLPAFGPRHDLVMQKAACPACFGSQNFLLAGGSMPSSVAVVAKGISVSGSF